MIYKITSRAENILFQEYDRLILLAPIFFGIGIGTYFHLPYEPALYTGILSFGGAVIMTLLIRRFFLLWIIFLALAISSAGFVAAGLRSHYLNTPVLEKKTLPRLITGKVVELRHYVDGKLHLTIENPEIAGVKKLHKVRIKVHKYDVLPEPGDKVSIRAGLLPPPPPTMPGDFDYARKFWFQGIGAVGYAVTRPVILEKGDASSGAMSRIRYVMSEQIRSTLKGDAGGLAAALITGMRDGISERVADNMRGSGLAHLLAISGLHMGLLCGAAFFLSRLLLARSEYLALHYPIKKWAALIAIGAGVIYVLLSGGSVPTIRAFIMAFILFLGILTDRKAISLRLVAIAAMIILIMTPEALLSVSFQMSFSAVVALVAVYEKIADKWGNLFRQNYSWPKKLAFYVMASLLTTLIAEVAIAPFALFHFNKLVHFGLVANLFAMPVMAFWVMPCIVVYLILAPAGLGEWALYAMSYGLEAIMFIADKVANAPYSYSLVPEFSLLSLVLMTLGALWFGIWRLRWKYWGLPVILIGFVGAFFTERPDILIDNSGRLIGVRDSNNEISLSSLRSGRITRERWARRFGQERAEKWHYDGEGESLTDWMTCDALGCLYRPDNGTDIVIALIKDELALTEDCQNADMVISLVPVNIKCPSARLVIDKWDFYHRGGHALWLPEETGGWITVKTVADSRGDRPWSRRR